MKPMEIRTRGQLINEGFTDASIRAALKSGSLQRLGRGRYGRRRPDNSEDRVLALMAGRDDVLCLEAAAVWHGLPLRHRLEEISVLRPGNGRSRRREGWMVLTGDLPSADVELVGSLRVTTVARTVVDLARLRGLEQALVPWEAARWRARTGRTLEEFDQGVDLVIDCQARLKGVGLARRARQMASAHSESPMETLSLWHMRELGVPAPVQQFDVLDVAGHCRGTCDFAWPELGVVGEYDGQEKYDRLRRVGESPADVVRREKRRQESIEELGWVFARWGKEELANPVLMKRRIEQAIAIAQGLPRAV